MSPTEPVPNGPVPYVPVMTVIDIVVSALHASMAFYRLLGIDFAVDPSFPGHAGVDLPGGPHLMLDAEYLRGPTLDGWTRPRGGPRTFLAFQFATPAEVDAKYTELTSAGYVSAAKPYDAFWGMRYATVLDPDGNGVDLYATLPE